MTDQTGDSAEPLSISQFAGLLAAEPTPEATEAPVTEEVEQEATEAEGPDDVEELEEQPEEVEEKEAAPVELEITLPSGEKLKVTPEEVGKSYERQADYTKKTMEIAEQRKAHEAAFTQYEQAVSAELERLKSQHIAAYEQADLTPQQWEQLKAQDPETYLIKREEMRDRQAQIQHLHDQSLQKQQQLTALQRKQMLEMVEQADTQLASRIPDWSDPVAKPKLQTQIAGYLQELGYKPEELDGLADARAVEVAFKAMQWDALQKGKPLAAKKVTAAPKVARPGAGAEKGDSERVALQAASKRFRQSGKVSDFASILKARNLV